MSSEYVNKKAKRMYELYLNNLPCKKVYAAVLKGDKFVVLKNEKSKNYKYEIAGGGVEDGETGEQAIKREILEELNMNVNVVKLLGTDSYKATWHYEDKQFDVNYKVEIYLTEFVSYANNNKFGLEGEFDGDNGITGIMEVTKQEMLENVYEFKSGGIKF